VGRGGGQHDATERYAGSCLPSVAAGAVHKRFLIMIFDRWIRTSGAGNPRRCLVLGALVFIVVFEWALSIVLVLLAQ